MPGECHARVSEKTKVEKSDFWIWVSALGRGRKCDTLCFKSTQENLFFFPASFGTISNVFCKQNECLRGSCVWEILSSLIALKSLNWPLVSSMLSRLCRLWRDLKSVLLHWYGTLSASQESLCPLWIHMPVLARWCWIWVPSKAAH